MTLFIVGLVLLVAWPLYNLVLASYMTRDSALNRRRLDSSPPTLHEPVVYWIVVPCLNEERVVANTVRNALALQGPTGTTTRVLVVDDGSDDQTPAIISAIAHPNLHVLRRDLPDAQAGKGDALNAAYEFIRTRTAQDGMDPELVAVGIIDGDGRGSANLLVEVSRAMRREEVGAVQIGVRIHNRNRMLAAIQDLEFACIVNASQLMRRSTGSVGLGGNGQFARLSALMRLGDTPWSTCLVEDYEMGLRMHMAGIRVGYVSGASVTQQGLTSVRRLLRQRTRWAQGNLQCVRYVPKLFASGINRFALAEILYYLVAPWWNAIGTIGTVAALAYPVWMRGDRDWSLLAVAGAGWTVAMITPFVMWGVLHRLQLGDERLSRCLLAGFAYPLFLLLGLISTCRAIGRLMSRRRTWAKTERLADEEPAYEDRTAQAMSRA